MDPKNKKVKSNKSLEERVDEDLVIPDRTIWPFSKKNGDLHILKEGGVELVPNCQYIKPGVFKAVKNTGNNRFYSFYGDKKPVFSKLLREMELEDSKWVLKYAEILNEGGIFPPNTDWEIYQLKIGGNKRFSIYSDMPELKTGPEHSLDYHVLKTRVKNQLEVDSGELVFPDAISINSGEHKNGKSYMFDLHLLGGYSIEEIKSLFEENPELSTV